VTFFVGVLMSFLFSSSVYAWDPLTGGDHAGADWTISVNGEVAGTHTNVGHFKVNTGITATVKAYNGTSYGSFVVESTQTTIDGTLTAYNAGYRPGQGSGGGSNDSGGGHGNTGGWGANVGSPGTSFGSTFAPITFGGAGGSRNCGGTGGGGAIKITTSGTMSVAGTIAANGQNASCNDGGGAGGSVYLIAGSVTGNGTISANGGNVADTANSGRGSGGRISINYSSSYDFSGTMQATGTYSGGSRFGGNGTMVVIDTTNNDLYINSSQSWSANPAKEGRYHTYRNVVIRNSSTLTLAGYWTNDSNGYGFSFTTTNFTVESGSHVSTDGTGYTATRGPGGGTSDSAGSYGGVGGDGWNVGSPKATYGSITAPLDLGSGGGDRTCASGVGGGAIYIMATGTLNVAGSIHSNGSGGGCAEGAGSGGSVYIIAGILEGAGSITANGGAAPAANAGKGGGGRIAIKLSEQDNFSGTKTALGTTGSVGVNGANGTIYETGYPPIPTMAQRKLDDATVIATGGTTSETSVIFKLTGGNSEAAVLTPEIEVRSLGTPFTNAPTATGSATQYTDTPITTSITVNNFSDATNYHWQGRFCDSTTACSAWTPYGNNAEASSDFYVFLNLNPNIPVISTASADLKYFDNSFGHDDTPSLNFSISDPDEGNTLSYRIQISVNPDYSSPVVDYSSFLGDAGAKTFTVGQIAGDGLYTAGSFGQTLGNGSYYWRVMTTDNSNATSAWTAASVGTSAFRVDINNIETNATQFAGVTNNTWVKDLPTISYTAGIDSGSGTFGYCISLKEAEIAEVPATNDPAIEAGVLEALDDGVDNDNCPYIVTTNSVNFSSLPGLNLTSNKHYYFSIKAIDQAGNIYTDSDPDTYLNVNNFKYDSTRPLNVNAISGAGGSFSNISDMYFNWPINQATDSGSGLLGFQYSINDQSHWTGTQTDAQTSLNYVSIDEEQPFNFSTLTDGPQMIVGENVIYFRTVDVAGNTSAPETYRTTMVSYGGAAPTFLGNAEVTITPSTNTSNSYGLAWSEASPSAGRTVTNYYYMINTTPPATVATLRGNSAVYVPTAESSVSARMLPGVIRGSNTVYVVVVDDLDNYSPSNFLRANFTLDSENPDPPVDLSAADSSLKASSLWRGSLAWGAPAYKGTGDLSYFVQRSEDGSTWTDIATTSGTAYVDTVPKSQKYYWRVAATDSSDLSKASPSWANAVTLTPKGSYTSAPDLSSGPTVSNITTKKAKISWSTSRNADSKISFGTETGKYYTEEPSNSTQETDHTINLTNLSPSTTYYYVAKWTDEDGNTGSSTEKSFTTSPAPSISSVKESDVSLYSALITFTVKDASKASLYFGETSSYGGISVTNTSTAETTYSIKLENLTDGTIYHYKLRLEDSENGEYDFEDHTFTTLPRPKISNMEISQVTNTSQTTLYITWKSNTEISSIVTFYPNGQVNEARDEVSVVMTKDHQTILRGLLPDTSYTLVVKGRDKVGNEGSSDRITFTTATDTRPPQVSSVRAEGGEVIQSANGSDDVVSQLIVSWNTDEPSTSQVEFGEGTGIDYPQRTQEDGNLTLNHMVIIGNLSPSKVYHLKAVSKDKAGNVGTSLDLVTITPKITDSAFGLVVTNLQEAFGFLGGIR